MKIPMAFFKELDQNILKSVLKQKKYKIAKTILRKKNRAERTMLLDSRLYYKVTVNKTV